MGAGFARSLLGRNGSEFETSEGDAARFHRRLRDHAQIPRALARRGLHPRHRTSRRSHAGAGIVPVEPPFFCLSSGDWRFFRAPRNLETDIPPIPAANFLLRVRNTARTFRSAGSLGSPMEPALRNVRAVFRTRKRKFAAGIGGMSVSRFLGARKKRQSPDDRQKNGGSTGTIPAPAWLRRLVRWRGCKPRRASARGICAWSRRRR